MIYHDWSITPLHSPLSVARNIRIFHVSPCGSCRLLAQERSTRWAKRRMPFSAAEPGASACAITWKHHQQLRTYNWPTLNNWTLQRGPNYPGFLPWHPGWSHFILSDAHPCLADVPWCCLSAFLARIWPAKGLHPGWVTVPWSGEGNYTEHGIHYLYIYIFIIYLFILFLFIYLFICYIYMIL